MGSASGGAVVALVLFVMSGQSVAAAPGGGPIMPAIGPALAGGGGALAGALVAWALARPLANAFRRAALAMMAVMGTALVAGATLPAHALAGRAGLAGVAAACLVAILVARHVFLGGTD